MYLLDANVVSELRKPRPQGAVLAWIASVDDSELYLSAVTVGEIQAGIELTRDQDPSKAAALETWLDQVVATHNVLPMSAPIFRNWARLMHRKSDTLHEDAMNAATVRVHNLVVVTRDVADFGRQGVELFNPLSPPALA